MTIDDRKRLKLLQFRAPDASEEGRECTMAASAPSRVSQVPAGNSFSAVSIGREERISRLAGQVQAGTYMIDSRVVSRALVGETLKRPEDH